VRKPFPAGYCLTPTADLAKIERGPISTSTPFLSVWHQTGRSLRKNQSVCPRSPPLTVEYSLAAGGAQRQWLQACLPDGHKPQCLLSLRDSSLISTSVRMVHLRRTSDEKRPGQGRQRINPREFATTGPRTPETAANFLLHRGLRQDGGGDQRGVSQFPVSHFVRKNRGSPENALR